jgi:predicted PurR-regulated permease PerM
VQSLATSTWMLRGITLLVVGVILYLAVQVLWPFWGIMATAMIFAVFLNPVYRRILVKTGRQSISGLLTVLFLLLSIVVPVSILVSNLVSEIVSAARQLQDSPEWLTAIQSAAENQLAQWGIPAGLSTTQIGNELSQYLSFFARNIGDIALRSGSMLLNLFFMLLLLYFLLVNQEKIKKYITDLSLFPRHYFDLLSTRTIEIINGTVRGYLLVVLLQSLVGISGFLVFGIPSAFMLGSFYGLSSLLPVVGGFLLWVPVAIYLMVTGNTMTAILLIIWFFGLSFVVENLIAPRIIGESTKLHQLLVMFSVFGGIQQFGLLGMVLGPVIMALAIIALEIMSELAAREKQI